MLRTNRKRTKRAKRRPKRSNMNKSRTNGLVLDKSQIPKSDMSLTGNITNTNFNMVYKLTRVTPLTYQTFVTNSHLGFSFKLSELSEVADFSNLFDEYRITSITWHLFPQINTVDAGETLSALPSTDPGMFQFVVDFDDDDSPTSEATLQQYPTYRAMPFRGPRISTTITPAVSVPVFQSSITTAYAPKKMQWLDLRYPDVPHYGWKYWFKSSTTDPLQKYPYYQQFVAHLEFRRVR